MRPESSYFKRIKCQWDKIQVETEHRIFFDHFWKLLHQEFVLIIAMYRTSLISNAHLRKHNQVLSTFILFGNLILFGLCWENTSAGSLFCASLSKADVTKKNIEKLFETW